MVCQLQNKKKAYKRRKLISEVLGRNPSTTFVIIDELDTDNWGIGGESITNRRKRENLE